MVAVSSIMRIALQSYVRKAKAKTRKSMTCRFQDRL